MYDVLIFSVKTSSKFARNFTTWLSRITNRMNRSVKKYIIDFSWIDRGYPLQSSEIRIKGSRNFRIKPRLIWIFLSNLNSAVQLKSLHSLDTIRPRPSKFQHPPLSVFNEITISSISRGETQDLANYRRPIGVLDNVALSSDPRNYRTLFVSARHVRGATWKR